MSAQGREEPGRARCPVRRSLRTLYDADDGVWGKAGYLQNGGGDGRCGSSLQGPGLGLNNPAGGVTRLHFGY